MAYIGGVMTGRENAPDPLPVEQTALQTEASKEEAAPILKPEELTFARALRGDLATTASQPPAQAVEEAENVGNEQPEDDPQVYDYLFQLGAFRDEDTVDSLRQTLEGYGYRTSMKQSGKMFLVLVRLRGNGTQANEVIATARELRLGNPLILEKKPVDLPQSLPDEPVN